MWRNVTSSSSATGFLAQPIWRLGRRQHPERPDAGVAGMGERQQQQFEIDDIAVVGAPAQARHRAHVLVGHDAEQFLNEIAAGLAPERAEGLALDLAAEQRADPGTGQPEAELIDEIRRQHDGIAKRVPDGDRIDVGTLGCRTRAPLRVPIIEHGFG